MSRPLTIIALILGIIAAIFFFAKLAADFLIVLVLGAIILLAIGILVGK